MNEGKVSYAFYERARPVLAESPAIDLPLDRPELTVDLELLTLEARVRLGLITGVPASVLGSSRPKPGLIRPCLRKPATVPNLPKAAQLASSSSTSADGLATAQRS